MKTERTGRELCLFLIVMYRIQGKKQQQTQQNMTVSFQRADIHFLKKQFCTLLI